MPGTTTDPREFLGPGRDPADFEQVMDIVDVWFDSGSTHAFVLEARPDLAWPASLYLEGSDQHRGWFHSSLLESCGTRGRAPYDAVLTHGFVLDEQGRKMSKSLGNVVSPQDVVAASGADILRLWVVASDYSEDLRIGPEILKYQADVYRRLRNTLRYLLGSLAGLHARPSGSRPTRCPSSSAIVLHRLAELDALVRAAYGRLTTSTRMFTALHNFCAVDLSAFYFDVRKDVLYCDAPGALRRRAARTVLDHVFDCLVRWLAPVLCFTAEEAWLAPPRRRRGVERPSRALARPAGGVARSRRWARNGRASASCAASSPARSSWNARKSASARASRRRSRSSPIPPSSQRSRGSICRDLHHLGRHDRGGDAADDAFTLPDVPGVVVRVRRAAGREMPALLARPARGRRRCRASRPLPALCRRDGGACHGGGG